MQARIPDNFNCFLIENIFLPRVAELLIYNGKDLMQLKITDK